MLTLVASAADISWLSDVMTAPENVPEPERPLTPLLRDEQGRAITTREAWEDRRAELREAWLDFLGPLPQAPGPLTFKTLSTERLDQCTRILIRYEAEPGRFVDAYLLRPNDESAAKRSGVVVFHPTNVETINVVAGTGGRPEQHLGLRLAERGFVAICPANYLWEEPSYDKAVAAAKKRHPNSLGMATMVADGIRAVDLLAALPDVDPDRIGTIGQSLGAKEVLYLMAFDDRVKCGAASEGGVGLHSTNWDARWYLGPKINEDDFPLNHHELLAMIAPRSLLVIGGESGRGASDGDRSWPYIAAANEINRLYGEPASIGLLNHRQGHRLTPEYAEKAFEWLEASLDP